LCEQRFSKVHRSPPEGSTSGDYSNLNLQNMISNRHQNIFSAILINTGFYRFNS